MEVAQTLPVYRSALQALLDDAAVALSDAEAQALRAIVHERRNGRRDQARKPAPARVRTRANEIVALLGSAAKELRPRETQELEDLVAGTSAKEQVLPTFPVRLHRHGWPSR